MKETLGGKGANLAEMTRLGVPVPPGFTISTEVCAEFDRAEYGWAYDRRNEDLMERGRAQWGLEYEHPRRVWGGRLAPYAAVDVTAYEEDD